MNAQVGRREFIKLLGSAAATWPLAAHGQQPAVPVIEFLHGGSPTERAHLIPAFRQGLGAASRLSFSRAL